MVDFSPSPRGGLLDSGGRRGPEISPSPASWGARSPEQSRWGGLMASSGRRGGGIFGTPVLVLDVVKPCFKIMIFECKGSASGGLYGSQQRRGDMGGFGSPIPYKLALFWPMILNFDIFL